MAKSKPILRLDSAYDIHGFLDYMLVETVVEKRRCSKRFTLPYKAVIEPDPRYINAELVVEIYTYWNAKGSKDERDSDSEESARADTPTTRH